MFDESAVTLLSEMAGTHVVCMNPRGIGHSSAAPVPYTLGAMVEDIENVRRKLGIERWVFWGMSGGGWLGQVYVWDHAHACTQRRHPGERVLVLPLETRRR